MCEVDVWMADLPEPSRSRALLREILGRHLGMAPDDVPLAVEPGGRPVLTGRECDLRFSVSHTGELMVVAVAGGRDVGIDIERSDRRVAGGVLRRALDDRERAHLAALAPARRGEAALRLWTAKEAYAKAIGAGLAHRFSDIAVEDPLGDARLARPGWSLRRLDPPDGYVGALVVHASRLTVRLRRRV